MTDRPDIDAATDRIAAIARLRPDRHRRDRIRRERLRAEIAALLGEPEPAIALTTKGVCAVIGAQVEDHLVDALRRPFA